MGGEAATQTEAGSAVGVFIDWQNCYRTARDAFNFHEAGGIPGNVKPLALARLLASVREEGQRTGRLTKARIYTGRADPRRDPRTHAANSRQFEAWRNASEQVEVIARTLDYSLGRGREKGVDVALAIDLVRTSLFEHEYEVAVVVSADTDLIPALELLVERGGPKCIEVATWDGPHWSPQPLAIAGVRIRQHVLTEAVYEKIKDTTDYNVRQASTLSTQVPYGRRRRPGR